MAYVITALCVLIIIASFAAVVKNICAQLRGRGCGGGCRSCAGCGRCRSGEYENQTKISRRHLQ